MAYDIRTLSQSLLHQIIDLPAAPTSHTTITVHCTCGAQQTINFRSFWRKWHTKNNYLCKSCHVKTYATAGTRIEKFKQSFAKVARTSEHRTKCQNSGKKAWTNTTTRKRITEAVRQDNKTNPKKKEARRKALTTLMSKPWFKQHMASIRNIAHAHQRSDTDEFIAKAITIHGLKYDYSQVKYLNVHTNITIICPNHGEFQQTPHGHLQGKGCSKCATIVSKAHQTVLNMIPSDITVLTNDRTVIPPKEIDIWIPSRAIGIEIHGEYWHGVKIGMTQQEKQCMKWAHYNKANEAEAANIKLYQFWVDEINQNPDLIKSMIMHSLGMSRRIYARKCTIQTVTNDDLLEFMDSYHLQGHRPASVSYALLYGNEIVCALTLSKHSKLSWEIIRYACKAGTTVVGGFSRLLHRFMKDYNPPSIITFADRRISKGSLYRQYFTLDSITQPNYFYYKGCAISRQRCQKHKLPVLLDNFDPTRTEVDNMLNNGYVQVFDCGHIKFIWRRQT